MVIFKEDTDKKIRDDYNNYLEMNDEYDEGNITKNELESIINNLLVDYNLQVPHRIKMMSFDFYRMQVLEEFESYCKKENLTII